MNTSPNTEERIWAVFAHFSALALRMGLLLPVIGWSQWRSESNYASSQCLQALGYQSLVFTVWLVAYLLVILLALVMVTIKSAQAQRTGETFDPFTQSTIISVLVVAILILILYMILP